MTTATASLSPTRSANDLLRRAWFFSPLLTLAGLASLALIPLFILAALVDPRTITGAPAWIKPLKFALSIAIFSATFVAPPATSTSAPPSTQPSSVSWAA